MGRSLNAAMVVVAQIAEELGKRQPERHVGDRRAVVACIIRAKPLLLLLLSSFCAHSLPRPRSVALRTRIGEKAGELQMFFILRAVRAGARSFAPGPAQLCAGNGTRLRCDDWLLN